MEKLSTEKPRQKKPGKRATREEQEARYRDMDALMDQGYKPGEIVRAISPRYGISVRQAERDMQEVKSRRTQHLLLNTPAALRAEHYNKLSYLYRSTVQQGGWSTALKVLALQEELVDKYQDKGEKPNETLPDSSPTPPEELAALLGALETEWLDE